MLHVESDVNKVGGGCGKQSLIYLSLAVLWVIGNESEAVMHGGGSLIYKSTLLSTGVKEQR